MAAWKINNLRCHYSWHPSQFSPAKDIRRQWRRWRRSLTPQDLKILRLGADIWFRCHRSRVPRPNKRGWVDFFEGNRQASDNDFGWPKRNQFFPSAHFSNPSTLQCRCLLGQFSGLFRTHRLRSQWKCGFIGLYFVDLQGSFVYLGQKILLLFYICTYIVHSFIMFRNFIDFKHFLRNKDIDNE